MPWKPTKYAGWGRAITAKGEITRPTDRTRAENLSLDAPAMGMRRSYGDAALNDGGRMIDMTKLDRIISFDETTGILDVEAGARIGDIATLLAPRGWMPAVMPGTGFATIGGCIAQDVHGKNHHHAGSFGQHLLEITLAQHGKTCLALPETDLFRATCGGLGQTGVIISAKLQLIRTLGDIVTVTERRAENWAEHLSMLDQSTASYTVGWIDATATGTGLGRGIVEEGESAKGLANPRETPMKVPMDAPRWALAAPIVRAFNTLYFYRVPARGRTLVKPLTDFFFPLDKIHDWNRLYGKRGFHQFQCVVPLDQAETLRGMLLDIATSGLASPLAVLKRMGTGRAGYLSFPMEGYTLAIDFPNRAAARELIRSLEMRAVDAGGRLYFAKDALAEAAKIRVMYAELGAWQAEVEKADPDAVYETDLVRRLGLRSA
ncbi:FAD-dependent oxidoreductase [Albirhodobacter sp. R86504]|uniref:FAD-binding oxidoreductase n=1 Tax=Albirhodobacter sp. R86504 TaxID=3093848 RepID=UPI00367214A1